MNQKELKHLIELYNDLCDDGDTVYPNLALDSESNADVAYRVCKRLLDEWDLSLFEEWGYSTAPGYDTLHDLVIGLLDFTLESMNDY